MEHLLVVAITLGFATFVTGLLLPVLARHSGSVEERERQLADELAATR
jgi:hypothetical protein